MRTIRATAEIPLVHILSENQQTNLFNGLFFLNGLDSILKCNLKCFVFWMEERKKERKKGRKKERKNKTKIYKTLCCLPDSMAEAEALMETNVCCLFL
jgi:hypothetical protein